MQRRYHVRHIRLWLWESGRGHLSPAAKPSSALTISRSPVSEILKKKRSAARLRSHIIFYLVKELLNRTKWNRTKGRNIVHSRWGWSTQMASASWRCPPLPDSLDLHRPSWRERQQKSPLNQVRVCPYEATPLGLGMADPGPSERLCGVRHKKNKCLISHFVHILNKMQ